MTEDVILRFPAIVSDSEKQTASYGRAIAERLHEGMLVLLKGDLGAGKTFLIQAIAAELGVSGVKSPTFNIEVCHKAHDRPFDFVHFDLYRLQTVSPQDDEALRIEEQLSEGNLVMIEWAERLCGVCPDEALEIKLTPFEIDKRIIEFSSYGRRASDFLSSIFPELLDIAHERRIAGRCH